MSTAEYIAQFIFYAALAFVGGTVVGATSRYLVDKARWALEGRKAAKRRKADREAVRAHILANPGMVQRVSAVTGLPESAVRSRFADWALKDLEDL